MFLLMNCAISQTNICQKSRERHLNSSTQVELLRCFTLIRWSFTKTFHWWDLMKLQNRHLIAANSSDENLHLELIAWNSRLKSFLLRSLTRFMIHESPSKAHFSPPRAASACVNLLHIKRAISHLTRAPVTLIICRTARQPRDAYDLQFALSSR